VDVGEGLEDESEVEEGYYRIVEVSFHERGQLFGDLVGLGMRR
jgi:hypothetical protein